MCAYVPMILCVKEYIDHIDTVEERKTYVCRCAYDPMC